MTVSVRALGSLGSRIPANMVVNNVETAGEAITRVGLPDSEGLAILINGHIANWDTPLHDGDVLQLVPQISGGENDFRLAILDFGLGITVRQSKI
jgi:molybdopterin converting factor small subunit